MMNIKFISIIISVFLFISTAASVTLEGGRRGQRQKQIQKMKSSHNTMKEIPAQSITNQQRDDLKYMWEEEKLARDVYLTLSYHGRIFQNIAKSEQNHMDAIEVLLEKYKIAKPASEIIGEFKTAMFKKLFDELTTRGRLSFRDAIQVGLEIENLDITDLQTRMIGAPEDFVLVFKRLLNASFKHRAAFERQL